MADFDDTDTWGMRPRFKLRQVSMDGPLFLAIDPLSDALPILSEGFIGLELKPGTSREEAQALIYQLNNMVAFVSYTGGPPAWNPTPGRSGRKPLAA